MSNEAMTAHWTPPYVRNYRSYLVREDGAILGEVRDSPGKELVTNHEVTVSLNIVGGPPYISKWVHPRDAFTYLAKFFAEEFSVTIKPFEGDVP